MNHTWSPRRLLEAEVARRAAPDRAAAGASRARADRARRSRRAACGRVVIGGVIDRDHLEDRPHVLAEDRGQAGVEEGLLAMHRQDEAQPGGHWLASYPMTVSARVFVDVPVLCGHRGSGRGVGREHAAVVPRCGRRRDDLGRGRRAHERRRRARRLPRGRGRPTGATSRACAHRETDALGLMRVGDLLEDLPPHIGVDIDLKTSLEDAQRHRDETTAALVADLVKPHADRPAAPRDELRPVSADHRARARARTWRSGLLTLAALPAAQGDPGGRPPRPAGHRPARRVLRPAPAAPRARASERSRTPSRSRTPPASRSSPGAPCARSAASCSTRASTASCVDDVL